MERLVTINAIRLIVLFRENLFPKSEFRIAIKLKKPQTEGKNDRQINWHDFVMVAVAKTQCMVNINDFRVMTFEGKCDVVTYYGQYLAHRFLGECKVFLYGADNFFIEVYYSPKYQKVLMINAFDQSAGLESYLELISLADLESRPIM